MKAEDLDHIEQGLALTLPADYRAAMMAYPFPPDSLAAELWVLDDVKRILELNSDYRRMTKGEAAWPRHLFLIGDDGSEEAFVLDTSATPSPVLVYELETGKLRPCTSDFVSFLRMQAEDLKEVEASERAMAEAYRTKKWWQFWIRPYPSRRAT